MTRPPAPALSPAEAATVARFVAAPVPPEVVVEAVARALWEADHDRTAWEDATQDGPDNYRRLAAAAIAAMPPSPATEAVERFAEWVVSLDDDDPESPGRMDRRTVTLTQIVARAHAALASPAPAPRDPEWEDRYQRGFTCPTCRGIGRTIHNDLPDGTSRTQGCLVCDGTGVAPAPAPNAEEGR